MKFGLSRKPGYEYSCSPRKKAAPRRDIYSKTDEYFKQRAKTYSCPAIIGFPPKAVRGDFGQTQAPTADKNGFQIVAESPHPEEPKLMKALKDSSMNMRTFTNELEVSKLMESLGLKKWCGEFVSETSQTPNIYRVWTNVEVYQSISQWLYQKEGVVEIQRGYLFQHLDRLINANKNLPELEDKFLKDDRETCYLPFKNGVVRIKEDDIALIPYNRLTGWVWEHNIIERDFEHTDLKGNWWEFLQRTCSERGENGLVDGSFEEQRFEALLCAIGYNIHRYKRASQPALTIFSDEYNGKKNDGGTGKGIIAKSPEKMKRNMVTLDGRGIKPDSQFLFQRVNAATDLLLFEDLDFSKFPIQRLYSLLTDGFPYERKYKDEVRISPEDAPKMVVTTNNTSNVGTDGSDRRRRMDMQLKHYYSNTHQPTDDFGKEFWDEDWTDEDWNQFYNVQIYAVQKSLQHNVAKDGLPYYPNTILEDGMRQEISEELIELFDTKLSALIEAGGVIKLPNEELSRWVEGMDSKVIKSKLVKYHQLKLEERYNIEDKGFKITGDPKTTRGIKLSPKNRLMSGPVPPSQS